MRLIRRFYHYLTDDDYTLEICGSREWLAAHPINRED